MSYDDWKTDPEYGMSNADLLAREREAEHLTEIETLKFDLAQAEGQNDKLAAGIDTMQTAIAEKVDEIAKLEAMEIKLRQALVDRKIEISQLQAKVDNMTSLLEEILEYCHDNYDVDPDPSGGHHDVPNWFMRTGTEIEEVLGRGEKYGQGVPDEDDPSYRADMINAGRGHLLK